MSTSLIVTRNVSNRIRGFLASSMLEVGPGIYISPRQSPAVRKRIWAVLGEWFSAEADASIVLLWQDNSIPGGLKIKCLGLPPVDIKEVDGMLLTRRPKPSRDLKKEGE